MQSRNLVVCAVALAAAGTVCAQPIITTFDNGLEGWSISGRTRIERSGGNPGANLHEPLSAFGAGIRNTTNASLLGDLTVRGAFRLTVDIEVLELLFFGQPVERELIVELRDLTNKNGYPYTSVYTSVGVLTQSTPGWITYSATVSDPHSQVLPAGWGGTGGEDPVTFAPILEPGRTFESVLASVDEIHFTTFVPGFFYGETYFDVRVDNVGILFESRCYADCDTSTGAGVLDIFDFLCFQDAFVAGTPYACECDTSTGPGVCDVFDFLCFQDAFVGGCP